MLFYISENKSREIETEVVSSELTNASPSANTAGKDINLTGDLKKNSGSHIIQPSLVTHHKKNYICIYNLICKSLLF